MNELIETLIESNKVQARTMKNMLENQQLLLERIETLEEKVSGMYGRIMKLELSNSNRNDDGLA